MVSSPLKISDIVNAIQADLRHSESLETEIVIQEFQTDSRRVQPGDIFVALVGENFDGHDFAEQAFANGAIAAVVSKPISQPHFLVADTLIAYGQIAKAHRQLLNAKVIAVTGSSGKTSTKDLLASVFRQFGKTVAPAGSLNNEIGVPATILSADLDTEFLILEMGMRGFGQIAYLSEIARPDVGILLNIGSAHMELLGSREGILQAKAELLESLNESGIAVLNSDEPLMMAIAAQLRAKVLTFGEAPSSDIKVIEIGLSSDGTTEFEMEYQKTFHKVVLPLVGEHQALNAAAVTAAAVGLGFEINEIKPGLESANAPSVMRMQITQLPNSITIVNDAYNANPESMRAGLKALKMMANGRRTWAVLGEMRELGPIRVAAHDEIGRLCVRLDINRLVAIGEAGKIIQIGAAQEGSWGNEAEWVEDVSAAIAKLSVEVSAGDIIYIKASRAIGLERVAEALISSFSGENSAS